MSSAPQGLAAAGAASGGVHGANHRRPFSKQQGRVSIPKQGIVESDFVNDCHVEFSDGSVRSFAAMNCAVNSTCRVFWCLGVVSSRSSGRSRSRRKPLQLILKATGQSFTTMYLSSCVGVLPRTALILCTNRIRRCGCRSPFRWPAPWR